MYDLTFNAFANWALYFTYMRHEHRKEICNIDDRFAIRRYYCEKWQRIICSEGRSKVSKIQMVSNAYKHKSQKIYYCHQTKCVKNYMYACVPIKEQLFSLWFEICNKINWCMCWNGLSHIGTIVSCIFLFDRPFGHHCYKLVSIT